MRTLQLIAIMCTAVAMAAGWAHLLELPNKIALPPDDYLTVQQIYRGWALLGFVIVAAIVASGLLTWKQRGAPASFRFALIATICLASTLVVFFGVTFPVNQATENWTMLPEGWEALRRQWEWSHAFNAILYFVAMAALVLSVMRWPGR